MLWRSVSDYLFLYEDHSGPAMGLLFCGLQGVNCRAEESRDGRVCVDNSYSMWFVHDPGTRCGR